MSVPLLRVRHLTKHFGSLCAVNNVSFEITRGQSVGFIGANGAGKTTTMRLLATLELPDRGRIEIDGQDALLNADSFRSRLGWMPDAYGAYENMTVFEYLDFFARAYGLQGKTRHTRINEVMEFTGLSELEFREVTTLSKGQAQRACLGRTLLQDPDILLLDEPAAGLDPQARIEFKHLVRVLASQGKTLFISSHILSELEDMCDTMLFIDKGRIVHHGEAQSLKRRSSSELFVDIKFFKAADNFVEWISTQPGAKLIESIKDGYRVALDGANSEGAAQLLRELIKSDFPVYDYHEYQRRLEDAFVDILKSQRQSENDRSPT